MKKLIAWCKDHSLLLSTLILLAFIPLYPKIPLLDIKNTWVYIRVEDFVVLFVILGWGVLFLQNKVSLKTPLTIPIFLFWIIGAVATIHGILLIFPTLSTVFANVSLLSFVRRIEYMSVFFIAYSAMKNKATIQPVIFTVVLTALLVSLYGLGQKYLGMPAYLTMNEEFAKGTPLQLSVLSRISSTFAGHYDLAAYYVLILPIIASLIFGYRHWFMRVVLGSVVLIGLIVLFMTVSRISLFAVLFAFIIILLFQKPRIFLTLLPLVLIVSGVLVLKSPQLISRFGSTIKAIDIIVDATTGYPIGHVKEVPRSAFANKTVWQRFYLSIGDLATHSSPTASFTIPTEQLPSTVVLLTEPSALTGEDLPSGTGYINLTLSPVVKRLGSFYYEPSTTQSTSSAEVFVINGQYLMKKAYAYDISFTTRFQGEWPNALLAFKRNIFFGSGYGSVSLAVDNSYLRMLAEVGGLGLLSFVSIFLIIGVSVVSVWKKIESSIVRSFILGFGAGVVGLSINAIFIDVFEASKVAFTLWLLTGIVMGLTHAYIKIPMRFFIEVKKIMVSSYAMYVYLLIMVILLFSQMNRNYFVGDDFTWFRWAADCGTDGQCASFFTRIYEYVTQSQGFFYRPGTKIYFLIMYQLAWLNQASYHMVSLGLHYVVSVMVFFLGKKLFQRTIHASIAALLFVGLAGFSEALFWISATGFLFASCFMLCSLFAYIAWKETDKTLFVIATAIFSLLAMSFHELGVITPLLYVLYDYSIGGRLVTDIHIRIKRVHWILLLPVPMYALMRFISHSHWLNGDYSYNLIKLPLNIMGNIFGYILLSLTGSFGMPLYQIARSLMREHIILTTVLGIIGVLFFGLLAPKIKRLLSAQDRTIIGFSFVFFLVGLLPFLGLGNVSSRYGYFASIGIVYLLVFGLEKIYRFTRSSGKDVAVSVSILCVAIFFILQITSIQQLHRDWYEAGEKVKRFFVSMESSYQDNWSTDSMQFHFVNVPIRDRDAWVFPVGLSDAVWFVTKNPNARIYSWSTVQEPLDVLSADSKTQKIFVFGPEGELKEVKKEVEKK